MSCGGLPRRSAETGSISVLIPHAHLLCTRCGKVLDLEDDLISELDRNVMRTTGFLVNDRQLLLSGICADCLAAQQVRLTEETEDQQAV